MTSHTSVTAETFRSLPAEQVATLVRSAGNKVAVFPINGTRRWYLLEHPPQPGDGENYWPGYMEHASRRHVELYRLFFEHGVDTLLTPIFGPDILERGDGYMQMAAPGMAMLATHPIFTEFYQKHQVRVRFYGDHRKYLGPTPYAYLSDVFDEIAQKTLHHTRHRLFYGVFAHDAAETLGELAIRHHAQHGSPPDKKALVEMYYGEYVEPVSLFIGFDRFTAFDMPLISTGSEDLYFMVAPSSYLTADQLRDILYDHLFTRPGDEEPDYHDLSEQDWQEIRDFYRANTGQTLGIGSKHTRFGYWYPLPQVQLTAHFPDRNGSPKQSS